MSWIEDTARRARGAINFVNAAGESRLEIVAGLDLHYEETLDSGEWATRVDFTPDRIEDATLDGWRVTAANWRMEIGQPAGQADDGWLGFGGRQGAHTLYYRLKRWGYLHWPTRAWQDVGGAPDYDRINLSRTPNTVTVGPEGATVEIVASVDVAWTGIWTRDGGSVDLNWRGEGRGVKEMITVAQAAREDAETNAPATTAAADTYWGFLFELDARDIPRWRRNGVFLDPRSDIEDDGAAIELLDASNRLLARIPQDFVYSSGDPETAVALRKRIYRDAEDGRIYLFVGARLDQIAALTAGDLVYDPTFTSQPDEASAKDTHIYQSAPTTNYGGDTQHYVAGDSHMLIEFDCGSIPAGATCDSATLTLNRQYDYGSARTWTAYSLSSSRSDWEELQATWNVYKTGAAWGSGGAGQASVDYEASALGTGTLPGGEGDDAKFDIALSTGRVEGWFGPANTNYGLKITCNSFSWISSSSDGVVGDRPKLVIAYTLPPPDPAEAVGDTDGPVVVLGSSSVAPGAAEAVAASEGPAVLQGSAPPTPLAYMGNIFLTSRGARLSTILLATAGASWRIVGDNEIAWDLRDEFTTARSAGSVDGTAAEPGPGTRGGTDTGENITISGGKLTVADGEIDWTSTVLVYDAVTRAAGMMLVGEFDPGAATATMAGFSLFENTIGGVFAYHNSASTLGVFGTDARYGGGGMTIASSLSGNSRKYAIVLRADGMMVFLSDNAGEFKLLWVDGDYDTATLYPMLAHLDGDFTASFMRIPTTRWLPRPLASDGFGGTFGTTDGLGHAETTGLGAGGDGETWTQTTGTWEVSSGKAVCSTLSSSRGVATVALSTDDVFLSVDCVRTGDSVGMVARYADYDNCLLAYHDGTSALLVQRLAGSATTLITGAASYSAGAALRLWIDGQSARLYYNNALIGATASIDATLTNVKCGLYSTNVANTLDNFVAYETGTNGEYDADLGNYASDDGVATGPLEIGVTFERYAAHVTPK